MIICFKAYHQELPEFYGDFINGTFYGQIITAVGMYLNNGMYHILYAIVESEII